MKTKFNGILTLLLALMVQMTFAQGRTISGVVSDEMGPVADISVKIKGTTRGTVTDFDGNYAVEAKTGDILEFTHVSYATVVKTIGASNKINVMMKENGESLEEVIINALGVKKKKANDLTSSTSIKVETIEKSGESGLLQALAGKTSGVTVIKSSGDPGSGSFMQIRGANTILGNDQPMVVIDGVVVSSTNNSGRTDGVAASSRLNDIPASDIENVTVLKGAQAAAVYGSAAAAGVIVITTKSGKSDGSKKWKVNITSSFQTERINEEWALNNTFGQGWAGNFIEGISVSYGDKISSRSGAADDYITTGEYFEADSGKIYYPIANKNSTANFSKSNRDAVLGNGFTNNFDVSLQYGGEDGNTFISFSRWDQDGIIKNNSNYKRNTFRINNTTKYSKKLTGKISATYINSNTDLIQQGSNIQGLYLGFLRNPADFDLRDYKGTYYAADGTPLQNAHRAYRNPIGSGAGFFYNNPLWTVNEQDNNRKLNRFMITPELKFQLTNNISFITRYNLDSYSTKSHTYYPYNTAADYASGYFSKTDNSFRQHYLLAMFMGNGDIKSNIKYNWTLGANYENQQTEYIGGTVVNFINPLITLSDISIVGSSFAAQEDQSVFNDISKFAKNGAFAEVGFELYDQLLLGATGRIERSSALKDSFFYPSFSLGWKFSEMLGENDILNFGKIRATYGEVATAPIPYFNSTPFVPNVVNSSYGDELNGSVYGGLFNSSSRLGNPNLSIERVKEYELGTDLRLFKNIVNLGFTYYNRTTYDALVRQKLAPTTGYTETITNNGEISNKGIEVDLGLKVLNTEDLKWKINFNYSQNKNMVEKLEGGDVFLGGFTGTEASAREGQPLSVILGNVYLRDDAGNYDLDARGFPQLDPSGTKVIADPNADWKGGVNTKLSWKGFNISANVETSQGNDVWNGTKGVLMYFGRHADSANEVTVSATEAASIVNYQGNSISSLPYANQNSDGTYTVRGNLKDYGDGPVLLDQYWYTDIGGGFGGISEPAIEDGSWVKLREVTVGYDFKPDFLEHSGINNVNFSVSGRNLYTWTKVEGFDPESNLTGASKARGLEYFTNPSTKSFIFTVKVGF